MKQKGLGHVSTFMAQLGHNAEKHGLRTFAVVAKAHLDLAETNGVLAGADTVELLKLGLLNILVNWQRHVSGTNFRVQEASRRGALKGQETQAIGATAGAGDFGSRAISAEDERTWLGK